MKLLSTTALALLLGTGFAAADCVRVGLDVTCAGSDTDGFDDDDAGLTVTVANTGDVNVDGDAIRVDGDNTTVVNDGVIEGSDEAIVGGTGFTLINNGFVIADDKAVDADDLDGVTVVNNSIIDAGDKGIRIGDGEGATFTNTALGVVIAGDEGFEAGDDAVVINLGLIEAGDDAVQIGENGQITNAASGTMYSSSGDGIDIDSGVISNDGLISSDDATGAGIDVDTADGDLFITNAGTIRGGYGILVEDGTTDPVADPANIRRQIVSNSGLIEGTAGTALFLGAGDDFLDMIGDGEVIGDVDLGADNDTVAFSAYSGAMGGAGLFDGGTGEDSMTFQFLASTDIMAATLLNDVLTLDIRNDSLFFDPDFSVTSINFESYVFSDGTFTAAQLASAVSPIPLPGAGLLLLAGLGGLGLVRRRN